jgi:hypothetical protein
VTEFVDQVHAFVAAHPDPYTGSRRIQNELLDLHTSAAEHGIDTGPIEEMLVASTRRELVSHKQLTELRDEILASVQTAVVAV